MTLRIGEGPLRNGAWSEDPNFHRIGKPVDPLFSRGGERRCWHFKSDRTTWDDPIRGSGSTIGDPIGQIQSQDKIIPCTRLKEDIPMVRRLNHIQGQQIPLPEEINSDTLRDPLTVDHIHDDPIGSWLGFCIPDLEMGVVDMAKSNLDLIVRDGIPFQIDPFVTPDNFYSEDLILVDPTF